MANQTKITRSAKDEDCTVMIPGICRNRTETTVLAHLDGFGIARKAPDFLGAYCCYECHAVIGGHEKSIYSPEELLIFHYEGVFKTQQILFSKGLIKIP